MSIMLYLFTLIIAIFLIASIILIAATKKLNVLLWTLLSIIGYVFLELLLPLLNYLLLDFVFNYYSGFNYRVIIIAKALPIVYLIILLLIVMLKRSNKSELLMTNFMCEECGQSLKNDMIYCPSCGAVVNQSEIGG